MTQKEQELSRQIKELGSTQKKIKNALKAAETRREEFEQQLTEVEDNLCIDKKVLEELGRIVGRYFGYTITPDKFKEELDFIFSDKDIAEYVVEKMKSLPNSALLTELARILNEKPKVSKKASATDKNETVETTSGVSEE